jgi:hypothetical protein
MFRLCVCTLTVSAAVGFYQSTAFAFEVFAQYTFQQGDIDALPQGDNTHSARAARFMSA